MNRNTNQSHLDSFTSICREKITNITFFFGGAGSLKIGNTDSNEIYILGQKFVNKKQAAKKVQNMIWLTYRCDIQINNKLTSDNGWGCLIRVGQMFLANTIAEYFKFKGQKMDQSSKNSIITAFLDENNSNAKYSLLRIAESAQSRFNVKVGQWLNLSQICQVVRKLHFYNPMKGTDDLKMIVFHQNYIFIDELYQKIGLKMCQCGKRRIGCTQCSININLSDNYPSMKKKDQKINVHSNLNTPFTKTNPNFFRFQIIVMYITRIASDPIDPLSYSLLLELLHLQISLGIMGGVPSKAVYIVGTQDEKVVYLDPHYVQKPVYCSNLSSNYSTFSCTEYRFLTRQQIRPSMVLGFRLRSIQDLVLLIKQIDKIKMKLQNRSFIQWNWLNQCKLQQSFIEEDDDLKSYISDASFMI